MSHYSNIGYLALTVIPDSLKLEGPIDNSILDKADRHLIFHGDVILRADPEGTGIQYKRKTCHEFESDAGCAINWQKIPNTHQDTLEADFQTMTSGKEYSLLRIVQAA